MDINFLLLVAETANEASGGNSDLIIAAVSAAVAGFGVKVIDAILNRGSVRVDEATLIREELRNEAKLRADELREMREELDSWKERYYELLHQYEDVKLEMQMLKVLVAKNDNTKSDWFRTLSSIDIRQWF